jgi:hypothetical protein
MMWLASDGLWRIARGTALPLPVSGGQLYGPPAQFDSPARDGRRVGQPGGLWG